MKKSKKTNWLHVAISWGASIVILGAMFKINHWGGIFGTYMIAIGLATEAVLFFTLGFFPPAQEPAWEKVYPELNEDFDGGMSVVKGNGQVSEKNSLLKILGGEDVGEDVITKLSDGLKNFTDKVMQINHAADISLAADGLSDKMRMASSKLDVFSSAFERASAGLEAMSKSKADSDAYHYQIGRLTQNISLLNELYESELRGADNNLRQVNNFYANLNITLRSMTESVEDSTKVKEEVNKLIRNISQLNVFYANMLSAMNQPRM